MVTRSGESTSARARYSSSSRTAPSADVDGRDALGLEQLGDRRRGLGAALEPVVDALLVENDRRRVGLRVVAADRLDEAAVTRGAPVSDDDAPHRVLLPADAGEPHGNRQRFSLSNRLLRRDRVADAASALARELREVGHLALLDPLHQAPHLAELLDELVDLLHRRPGALGDPQAARALDDLGMRALVGRHREDDRLDAVELLLVDLHLRELVAGQARDHAQQARQRAHLADAAQLVEEVLERELVLAQLLLERTRLVLVDRALGLFDEAEHVAHAEDPLRHAVRVEALEIGQLLARGGEHDRLAGDGLDRQRGAAARVAVELGQHDAVELRDLGELLGYVDRVLAGHRVDDQQDDVRLDRLLDLGQLLHQVLVDVQAAGRVDDQHVLAVALGLVEGPARDVDRVAVRALLVDGGAGLGAHLDELVYGRRPVDVAGRKRDRGVVLLPEPARELGRRRGLARALEAGHQDHGRRPGRERQPGRRAAHQRGELLVDDLDDLLAGVELLGDLHPGRPLLDRVRELLDDLEVDVGLEQREPDLAHRAADVLLGKCATLSDALQGVLELFREGLEHCVLGYRRGRRSKLAARGRRVPGGRRGAGRAGRRTPVRRVRAGVPGEGRGAVAAAGSARSRGRECGSLDAGRAGRRGLDRGRVALVEPVVRDRLERTALAELRATGPLARASPAAPRARTASPVTARGRDGSRDQSHDRRPVAAGRERPALRRDRHLAGRAACRPAQPRPDGGLGALRRGDLAGARGRGGRRDGPRRPAPPVRLAGRAGPSVPGRASGRVPAPARGGDQAAG